jgi:hypothetical protein
MKTTQKGSIVPLILILVALALIAGGYYIYSQHTLTSSSQPIVDATSTPAIASSTQNKNIVAGFTRYIEPTIGLFELQYPTGWDVQAIKSSTTTEGGAEISPGKSAGITDPLIVVQVNALHETPQSFSFKTEEDQVLALMKANNFTVATSKEMTVGGDQAFYVSYVAPQDGIKGIFIYALASGTPDTNIIGVSPDLNDPVMISLEYKSATSTYSQNIENTIIATFKDHVINNGVLGQPYTSQLSDCLAGNLQEPPEFCFDFAFPQVTTFHQVMGACLALPDNKYITDLGPGEKASYYPANFSYQEYCVSHLSPNDSSAIISPGTNYPSNDFQQQFFGGEKLPPYNSFAIVELANQYNVKICTNYGSVTNSKTKSDRCLLTYLNKLPDEPGLISPGDRYLYCNALSSSSLSPECANLPGASSDDHSLETFENTAPVVTAVSGWTTFASSTLGISFNYPSNWKSPEVTYAADGFMSDQVFFKEGLFVDVGYKEPYTNKVDTLQEYENTMAGLSSSGISAKESTASFNGKSYAEITSYTYGQPEEEQVFIPNPTSPTRFATLDISIDSSRKIDESTFDSIVGSFAFTGGN